jgi:UDP-N-acetylmuramate dehydrogenase
MKSCGPKTVACDVQIKRNRDPGRFGVSLSPLTTLGLGGPARRLVEARTDEQIVDAVAVADRSGEALLVLGGGSNVVISDAGFDGTVVRILTRGVVASGGGERRRLRVSAGEPWEDLVGCCVAAGLAGIECLSGIPGLTGATPIQNVGAYGQQVSDTIGSVRAYDRETLSVVDLAHGRCEFGYRTSVMRHSARYVVLAVTFALERSLRARPIRYPELADALGARLGACPPIGAVREAVLALRRGKGMVLNPDDPDSRSAGSFFLNPVLSAAEFAALERRAAERLGRRARPPAWPEKTGRVKTSAAWLIEHAGYHRGYGRGQVGISSKHTLALVNRGGSSTAELLALASELRHGVLDAFGIALDPEPTLVGVTL